MIFRRFTEDARAVVLAAAQEEARLSGQAQVEAEHLLLALASHPDLRRLALDRDELAAALEHEEQESLAAVGVAIELFELDATPRPATRARLGSSAKVALQRALTVAVQRGDKRIRARHLLLGVLALERGRVPRALRLAGVDVDTLRTQL